jgi:hypothetical protein
VKNKLINSIFIFGGLSIIGYAIFIYLISPEYTYQAAPAQNEVRTYAYIRMIVGLIYTISVVLVIRKRLFNRKFLIYSFAVGLVARIILIPSEPILEDDFNRYLWDGAVTASGYNPYEFPPELLTLRDSSGILKYKDLNDLADSSEEIIGRINHPQIRTIYPPLAQGMFTISYLVKPWSVTVWKSLLFILDLIALYLLIILLRKTDKPAVLSIIYWWNPILLHEIFNAGHMDVIMYPFILLGLILFFKDKFVSSASMFALAAGGKIWPIIFLPFVFKKIIRNKKMLVLGSVIVFFIISIILLPIAVSKIDNSLGFVTYTKNWTNNESVFALINLLVKEIINLFKINYHCSLCITRWLIFIFYSIFIIKLLFNYNGGRKELICLFYYLIAVMFMISPTQFPWYYTWILPILVLNPRLSFIAYAVLLPLYQLRYSRPYLVWVEHLPIVILFVVEYFNLRVRSFLAIEDLKSKN